MGRKRENGKVRQKKRGGEKGKRINGFI